MTNIRMILSHPNWLKRQLPDEATSQIGDCKFYFDDERDSYDYCFVFDEVEIGISVNCPKENLILCVGEPKSVKIYPKSYYKQFGRVAAFYKFKGLENIDIKFPLLPWMAGLRFDINSKKWDDRNILSYSQLENFNFEDRLNKIAIITSNKVITKGHKRRLEFIHYIKNALPETIDIYGNGFMAIEDKLDVLKKYKYTLVLENSCFYNYWTEKLADAYLSGCYPFYLGSPNINEYFTPEEITSVNMKNPQECVCLLKNALSSDLYSLRLTNINSAKRKILTKCNAINLISKFIDFDKKSASLYSAVVLNTINPVNRSFFELLHSFFSLKYYQYFASDQSSFF